MTFKPTKEQEKEMLKEIYKDEQITDALDQLHDEDRQAMFRDEEWLAEQIFKTKHQNQ